MKERLREAAAYVSGGDLTAFIVATALERADRVLAERETFHLDDETRARFYEALRDTSPPSDALRRLLTEDDPRYRLVS